MWPACPPSFLYGVAASLGICTVVLAVVAWCSHGSDDDGVKDAVRRKRKELHVNATLN